MKCLYKGKTKDVYQLENGHVLLQFKDDVTGADGVFDPGANTVGLTIDGIGKSGLRMTEYFFKLLEKENIPTHFIEANIDESTMTVKKAQMFGNGIEVICRYKAVGSFVRRYGAYCEDGQALDGFVEFTLKDDERQDPPITRDGLVMLDIVTAGQYDIMKELTKTISSLVKETLAAKGLDLYDMKLEFGLDDQGEIMLIDEISAGNMRVYNNNAPLEPMEVERLLFA